MPISPEHAFEEKSTKLLILLPIRTIYNRTFQCETTCNTLNEELSEATLPMGHIQTKRIFIHPTFLLQQYFHTSIEN